MNPEIHRAALRAATKVAFSVAFVGCGGTSANPVASNDPTVSGNQESAYPKAGEGSNESSSGGYGGKADAEAPAKDASVEAQADAKVDAGPTDCATELASAFPVPGMYPGEKKEISEGASKCCIDVLAEGGGDSAYRWDCCANIAENDPRLGEQTHFLACTPWGPPVPPAMKLRGANVRFTGIA